MTILITYAFLYAAMRLINLKQVLFYATTESQQEYKKWEQEHLDKSLENAKHGIITVVVPAIGSTKLQRFWFYAGKYLAISDLLWLFVGGFSNYRLYFFGLLICIFLEIVLARTAPIKHAKWIRVSSFLIQISITIAMLVKYFDLYP